MNLAILKPNAFNESVSSSEESSPILPPFILFSPIYISPLKNVPVATITALALKSSPVLVFIPLISPFSTTSSVTIS